MCHNAIQGTKWHNSVVRGYHVYKDIWEATCSEMLNCTMQTENVFDPFAASVENVVMLSAICQENFLQSASCLCGVVQGVCGRWGYTMVSIMMALIFISSIGNSSDCCIGLIFMD